MIDPLEEAMLAALEAEDEDAEDERFMRQAEAIEPDDCLVPPTKPTSAKE